MKKDLEDVKLFIAQNFNRKIVLKDLAQKANLSEFHFHRRFKEEVGITPRQYIENLQLEYAIHLLKLFPKIKKIHLAFECGYNSPNAFNRAFKAKYDVTPSQFGRNNDILRALQLPKFEIQNLIETNVKIVYLPNIDLHCKIIKPIFADIETQIKKMSFETNSTFYGVYLDAPLHKKIEDCRYLIGQKSTDNMNYQIENGYYVKFNVRGDWTELLQQGTVVLNHIKRMKYQFKVPIAIESFEVHPENEEIRFLDLTRNVFIPIEKQLSR